MPKYNLQGLGRPDLQRQPRLGERFDKVVSNYVLHWLPDHAKALRNVLACLKPGGEALFTVGVRTTIIDGMTQYIRSHATWGAFVKVEPFIFTLICRQLF